MLRSEPAPARGASRARGGLVLYLEGPRDRDIFLAWARRLIPREASRLKRSVVILGGRQPARAVEHFRGLGGAEAGASGLCVLDRDGGREPEPAPDAEPGLEFFTWSRRHIESYLLVPKAIARALASRDDAGRLGRLLRRHLPPEADEDGFRDLDAKRILAPAGELARALGEPIPLARVARATRASELHPDVHACFDSVRRGLGLDETVVVRSA